MAEKIAFIATILNEEESIQEFVKSVLAQSKMPSEIILVDGGSTDKTLTILEKYTKKNIITVLLKPGNRSVGRNEAIRYSKSDILVVSDAGCILDTKFIEKIVEPFVDTDIDVVAGYYKGKAKTIFEKCVIPYVLVMEDKVDPQTFLPATRSMALRKSIWKKVDGFDEKYSHNEDYVFARKLKDTSAKIVFQKDAVVYWIPPTTLPHAFKMFYRFAYGDIEAKILRPKVAFIFLRYIFAIFSLLSVRFISEQFPIFLLCVYTVLYVVWSAQKNFKYVGHPSAWVILPFIQITVDIAVMMGSLHALFRTKIIPPILEFIRKDRISTGAIILFILLVLSVINWGLPNQNHQFTYHMDEWHQLQSVRSVFTYWSPNVEGAAHGPLFHFALSGVYVAVLYIFGLINPFAIDSSLTQLDTQNALFVYLRLSTLLFSIGTIVLLIGICKRYLKILNTYIPVILFAFSPIWLSLSNYFKYDIALLFWIVLFIYASFHYKEKPTLKNYLLVGIPVALAITTKISALPILVMYVLTYFLFAPDIKKNIIFVVKGLALFFVLFLFVGIPDVLLGRADYYDFFYSNLVSVPQETYNYILGKPYWVYLFTNQIPTLFGYAISVLMAFSLVYFIKDIAGIKFKEVYAQKKNELFLLLAFFLFAVSLIPMKLFIINRSLVVLPFAVLFITLVFQQIFKSNFKKKRLIQAILVLLLLVHVIQGISWVVIKYNDPRVVSSQWMQKNIQAGTVIGIENIPIYQSLPDIILKEFYTQEDKLPVLTVYNYQLVDAKSTNLPQYIVLTNADVEHRYMKKSQKKSLVERLEKEGYVQIQSFTPNWELNRLFTSRLDFFISLLDPSPVVTVYRK